MKTAAVIVELPCNSVEENLRHTGNERRVDERRENTIVGVLPARVGVAIDPPGPGQHSLQNWHWKNPLMDEEGEKQAVQNRPALVD